MNDTQLIGLSNPNHETMVRGMLADIGPSKTPDNGIVFLQPKDYDKFRSSMMQGQVGNSIARVGGGERTMGIGDGVSIVPSGRMWLNAKLLDNPKQLRSILAHELGHFAADPDRSEDAADKQKDVYLKRADNVGKIRDGVKALPVVTRSRMGDVLAGRYDGPTTIAKK